MKNLIICHTPLQTMIARKIVELYPDTEFDFIMFSSVVNDKIIFYFEQLERKCCVSKFFHLKGGLDFFLLLIKNRLFINSIYDKVFFASIDSLFIHTILSSIKFREIITFDDGTANFMKNSIFYVSHKSIKETIVRFVLLIKYDMNCIKNISKLHYTIYNMENIIANTYQIPLLEDKNVLCNSKSFSNRRIKILLGQPLYENIEENKELFQKIMNKYDLDFYFPHPREKYFIDNVSYIYTNMIFEDYICSLFYDYSSIDVFTVCSSAALNVINIPNVNVYSIFIPNNESNIEYMKKLGANILYLD
ncbi:glycosyltransferase family 52 [Ursidibacter arcticus]